MPACSALRPPELLSSCWQSYRVSPGGLLHQCEPLDGRWPFRESFHLLERLRDVRRLQGGFERAIVAPAFDEPELAGVAGDHQQVVLVAANLAPGRGQERGEHGLEGRLLTGARHVARDHVNGCWHVSSGAADVCGRSW